MIPPRTVNTTSSIGHLFRFFCTFLVPLKAGSSCSGRDWGFMGYMLASSALPLGGARSTHIISAMLVRLAPLPPPSPHTLLSLSRHVGLIFYRTNRFVRASLSTCRTSETVTRPSAWQTTIDWRLHPGCKYSFRQFLILQNARLISNNPTYYLTLLVIIRSQTLPPLQPISHWYTPLSLLLWRIRERK